MIKAKIKGSSSMAHSGFAGQGIRNITTHLSKGTGSKFMESSRAISIHRVEVIPTKKGSVSPIHGRLRRKLLYDI